MSGRAGVRPGVRPRTLVPLWAFVTVIFFAIIFAIVAGVLWFFLQKLRRDIQDPANSNCPQVLPQTCCKLDSSGNPLPACTNKCDTNADCPSYAPTCNSGTCA